MKLLLGELKSKKISKLIILSLERSLYQSSVVIDGEERTVWESDKKVLRSRNLPELREKFAGLAIDEVVLRHDSAYDEMVGQPLRDTRNRLEVALGDIEATSKQHRNYPAAPSTNTALSTILESA